VQSIPLQGIVSHPQNRGDSERVRAAQPLPFCPLYRSLSRREQTVPTPSALPVSTVA
jgi:hypothetical protein